MAIKELADNDMTDLVTAATAHASVAVVLAPVVGVKPQRIEPSELGKLLDVDDAAADAAAAKAKTDQLTVTAPVDLDSIRIRIASEHVNAKTDLGLTVNDETSRTTMISDPGSGVRAANKTALHSFLAGAATTPNTQREVFFPRGSYAIDGPLDTATYAAAFKNLTLRGVRSEYAVQSVESGQGGPEWMTRLDIYNASDDDYFIDLPGSSDKTIRPAMFHWHNMFCFLGSQKDMEDGNTLADAGSLASAAAKYASCKGGFLRIGDRSLTGNDTPSDWSDLARGVNLSGLSFSNWILSQNNDLYGTFQEQADGAVTFNFPHRGLVEFNRVYDLMMSECAYRGGIGYQLMLANCDRPYIRGSRHLLANAAILNGVAHGDPTDAGYDRDFLVDDGVAGVFSDVYFENPSVYGVFTAGGMWSNVRGEVGYQTLYPSGYGPGRYAMPTGSTWTIAWQQLAAPTDGELEEQYIQFANLPASITPYYGASTRAAVVSDYIRPGMTLRLNPAFPSVNGLPVLGTTDHRIPTLYLVVTAVDDTNGRAYFWGGYRSATGSIIGPNFFTRTLTGTASNCVRVVGVPFTICTGRGGLGMHSITQNDASPNLAVPRYIASFDRTIVPVGPYVGGHGTHASEERTESHRPIVSAYTRGQVDSQGCGVVHYGPIPPKSWALVGGWGTDLTDPPRPYKDYRLKQPHEFDFYTSPTTGYQSEPGDFNRLIESIDDPSMGKSVPVWGLDGFTDAGNVAWLPFNSLPAATYDYTIRLWSPITLRSNNLGTSIVEEVGGANDGKIKILFSANHWFHVGQLISIGNTTTYDHNTDNPVEILAVPDATSIVVDVAYVSDFSGTVHIYPNLNERLLLNFRTVASPSVGTNVYHNPGGNEWVEGIDAGWNTITGTTPADTTDMYFYTAAEKSLKVAWVGLE